MTEIMKKIVLSSVKSHIHAPTFLLCGPGTSLQLTRGTLGLETANKRMKGQGNQVSNGPKEQLGGVEGSNTAVGSEEFEPWRSQQQQAQQQNSAAATAAAAAHTPYGASVPISSATDIYNMSTGYYGSGGTYPYQAYGVGDGTWSNGTDPMTFLSGYPHDSYSMDGVFGPPSTTFSSPAAFGQPPPPTHPSSFNYFHPSNGGGATAAATGPPPRRPHPPRTTAAGAGSWQRRRRLRQPPRPLATTAPSTPTSTTTELKSSVDSKESLGSQPKKTTWASIASQPAKPQLTIQNQGTWDTGGGKSTPGGGVSSAVSSSNAASVVCPPLPTPAAAAPVQMPPPAMKSSGGGGWSASGGRSATSGGGAPPPYQPRTAGAAGLPQHPPPTSQDRLHRTRRPTKACINRHRSPIRNSTTINSIMYRV
nr:unnamed protein product [Callosobruchus chinensis]